jgi:hypothetical protein
MRPIPAFPQIPNGPTEIAKVFGDITRYVRNDATLSPEWEEKFITRLTLPKPVRYAFSSALITKITVHVLLLPVARLLYEEVTDIGLLDALGPYGGGFVYRPIGDASAISLHSFGIAWDWNPKEFPLRSLKKRDPRLLDVFHRYGFLNGGEFAGRKDPMHFQFATGA